MPLKVHVQKIWPSPENDTMVGASMADVYNGQMDLMRSILGPDSEIRVHHNDISTYYTACASMEAFNLVGMLNGLMKAEEDNCDVALIACGNDPGLAAARDLLSIPVVSVTESAMLMACQLGKKFGVVTMDDRSPSLVERNLEAYGLERRAIRYKPVRSAGFFEATSPWYTDRDYLRGEVIPRFEKVARGLIDDGADVIVTACGNFAVFSLEDYSHVSGTEVPVVEAVSAGTHMAKTMGEFYKRHKIGTSKHSAYCGVPKDVAVRMTAPFRTADLKSAQARVEAA